MKSAVHVTLLLLVSALSAPVVASDGDISIVAALTGTGQDRKVECDFWHIRWNDARVDRGKTPFGSCKPPVLEVYADLRGASAGGITGVEFGCMLGEDRYPDPGYLLIEIPVAQPTLSLGTAFTPPDADPRGMNMAWAECQTGTGGRILLERLLVFPTVPCGPGQEPPMLRLQVGQHARPSNRYFRCPLFTLCDAPAYTKVCLGDDFHECDIEVPPYSRIAYCSSSGSFVINGAPGGGPGRCGRHGKPDAVAAATWGAVKSLFR